MSGSVADELADVARRLGDDLLRRRLESEDRQIGRLFNPRGKFVHTENVFGMNTFLTLGLKLCGQWERGRREFHDIAEEQASKGRHAGDEPADKYEDPVQV